MPENSTTPTGFDVEEYRQYLNHQMSCAERRRVASTKRAEVARQEIDEALAEVLAYRDALSQLNAMTRVSS